MGGVIVVGGRFKRLESNGIIYTRRVTSREGDADVASGAREAREGCAFAFRVFPSAGERPSRRGTLWIFLYHRTDDR